MLFSWLAQGETDKTARDDLMSAAVMYVTQSPHQIPSHKELLDAPELFRVPAGEKGDQTCKDQQDGKVKTE